MKRRRARRRRAPSSPRRGFAAVTLTILHTSDLHGRVHPHDALADADLGEGLARVARGGPGDPGGGPPDAPARFRGHDRGLADAGARVRGPARRGDGSDPIVRAMNLVGYDAMAVGNHEFDFGVERLRRLAGRRRAFRGSRPTRSDPTASRRFRRTRSTRSAGVRVGILGLVTPARRQLGEPGAARRAALRRLGRGGAPLGAGPARPGALRRSSS